MFQDIEAGFSGLFRGESTINSSSETFLIVSLQGYFLLTVITQFSGFP